MPVEVGAGTPLAEALQNAVQSKLVEAGWSTGGMDEGLSEYILLMIVNGKTQEEIARELSTDLLDVGPDDPAPAEFARWLFEQAEALNDGGQPDQGAQPADVQAQTPDEILQTGLNSTANRAMQDASGQVAQDSEMNDATSPVASTSIPKGPKSMRDGTQRTRDQRMLGHMNRALSRNPDASLNRIKGTGNRIDTHNRQPPKGPTPKGPKVLTNRNPASQARQANAINSMQMGSMANAGSMNSIGNMQASNPLMALTPQQQMQMFAMYEEQARMFNQMQQMMPNPMGFGPNAPNGMANQSPPAKSLFERTERKTRRDFGHQNGNQSYQNRGTFSKDADEFDPTSSMEVEQDQRPDPTKTMCKFNLYCTKPDCHFVHQSPAAPPDTAVDMNDECSFGAACTSRKCVGKHPSPAKRSTHQSAQQCRFYPNCMNPNCQFSHPSTPPCRNGADCNVSGCKFFHNPMVCKFNPCLNPVCPYKHEEGQKQGKFQDKVWINPVADQGGEGQTTQHVSERKFVDDEAEEELILPGKGDGASGQGGKPLEEVVT